MNTFLVAKALVFNDRAELLLLRRGKTAPRRPLEWDLPGGMVEEDEPLDEAARRETKEETGLNISKPQLVYTKTEMRDANVVFLFFQALSPTTEVVLSNEHVDFKWFGIKTAANEIQYPLHKEVIQWLIDHPQLIPNLHS